jgi:hypothetical protein
MDNNDNTNKQELTPEQMDKYANVILFLCDELGGKIQGKDKLAALLYYVDFDHFQYKQSMRSITGDTYIARESGPYPEHLDQVLEYMVEHGMLEIGPPKSQDELRAEKRARARRRRQYVQNMHAL